MIIQGLSVRTSQNRTANKSAARRCDTKPICTNASKARLHAKDCVQKRSRTLRHKAYMHKRVQGTFTCQGLRTKAQQNAATQSLYAQTRPRHVYMPRTADKSAAKRCDTKPTCTNAFKARLHAKDRVQKRSKTLRHRAYMHKRVQGTLACPGLRLWETSRRPRQANVPWTHKVENAWAYVGKPLETVGKRLGIRRAPRR